jgi:flagellar basal-body rod protein FlgF
MSNAVYASLARQQGLMHELELVSTNLANASTAGYKSDRAIFAEFIVRTGPESASLSIGGLAGHAFELQQGALDFTGSPFDLALQGEGYFTIQTEQGTRLTRAGHFLLSAQGELVDPAGNAVLNSGGGPIILPPEARQISIASDGSLSADGVIVDQVGVVLAEGELLREAGTYFTAPDGFAQAPAPMVIQGALEQSNVSPVLEIARMIDVQRAYEAGQALLEQEDRRISQFISTLRDR